MIHLRYVTATKSFSPIEYRVRKTDTFDCFLNDSRLTRSVRRTLVKCHPRVGFEAPSCRFFSVRAINTHRFSLCLYLFIKRNSWIFKNLIQFIKIFSLLYIFLCFLNLQYIYIYLYIRIKRFIYNLDFSFSLVRLEWKHDDNSFINHSLRRINKIFNINKSLFLTSFLNFWF